MGQQINFKGILHTTDCRKFRYISKKVLMLTKDTTLPTSVRLFVADND